MDYTSGLMDMNGGGGGAPVTGFIFPILKPSEIQQCMNELGTELTNEELNDPAHHKEKLRKIFTFLVRMVDLLVYILCVVCFATTLMSFECSCLYSQTVSWKFAPVSVRKIFYQRLRC
jgi:Nuf2 family